MKFDAGSWWLLAGIITVMVTVIGALLTIIAKYLIWVPFQDLKISITHLTAQINELNTSLALQKQEHDNQKNNIIDIFDELEKHQGVLDKHQVALDRHEKVLKDSRTSHKLTNINKFGDQNDSDF